MEGRRDREEWIDIAKGIGIIFVVFCHIKVSFLTTYIYWFHMPLFFLISGYLHRQPDSLTEIFSVSVQKTYRLLIPYLSYYILILFCMKITFDLPLAISRQDIRALLIGGEYLTGSVGVFWFITVLYFTEITFLWINCFKKIWLTAAFVVFFYGLSHAPLIQNPCYQAADVMFYAILFYFTGYCIHRKKFIINSKRVFAGSAAAAVFFIFMQGTGFMEYSLAMKNKTYNHWILDIVIPLTFCMAVLCFSYKFQKVCWSRYIAWVGRYSLPVMYLHIPIFYICREWITFRYSMAVLFLLSIIVPILLSVLIFEKIPLLGILFMGDKVRSVRWISTKIKRKREYL